MTIGKTNKTRFAGDGGNVANDIAAAICKQPEKGGA